MSYALQNLRERLATEEKSLSEKSGRHVLFSEHGPISFGLIKAMIDVVEQQAREIEELKKRGGTRV